MSNNYLTEEDLEIEALIDSLGRQSIKPKKKIMKRDRCLRLFLSDQKKKKKQQIEKYQRRKQLKRRELYGESNLESNSIGAIDTRQGVQLLSREVTSMADRSGYTGDHEMSDSTIKETPWDLSRIVERPTLVTSLAWATTSTILYTGSVPASVLPIKLAKIPFQTFQYWNGDVILRLQVAGSPIVQGILAMTFVPLVSLNELNSMSWDFSSLSINPTVYLYANTNTHAELRIPYNHPQSYLTTNFPTDPMSVGISQNLGFVLIYVLEPLIAVGSVTSVNVSLFSIMENNQFKVPRMSSAILTGEAGFLTSALSSLSTVGSSLLGSAMSEFGSHVKEKVHSKIHKTHNDLVSDMSSKALPSNFVGDAIDIASGLFDTVTGFLGLDNPTIPCENSRTIIKSNGSMNYAVGPEFIEKMSVFPSAMSLVTPETFATVTDEMDVGYLYRRYSYFGRFSITKATDGTGAVVFSCPLSPFPTLQNDPVGLSGFPVVSIASFVQSKVSFPLLSYLGLPYRYWTGGLKYKFIVCSSSLHTCKLFIAFNYGVWVKPASLLDATSQYGVALEVSQGSNEFEFAVPYIASVPYKEVCRGRTAMENSMGTMNVVVMNPLIAPDTVASSISIAVFIAGSDDFSYEYLSPMNPAIPIFAAGKPAVRGLPNEAALELTGNNAYLRHNVLTRAPDVEDSEWDLQGESGIIDPQTVAPTNVAPTVTDMAIGEEEGDADVQVSPPQAALVVDDHFGITSISLRNLAKKYQMLGSFTFLSNPLGSTNHAYFRYNLEDCFSIGNMSAPVGYSGATIPARKPNGLLTWMSAMYRQFKGSLRFKAVLYVTNDYVSHLSSAQVFYLPGPRLIDSPSDVLSMMAVTGRYVTDDKNYFSPIINTNRTMILTTVASNVLEFEVPYSSYFQSVLVSSGDDNDGIYQGLGSIVIVIPNQNVAGVVLDLYAAFGDETRFGTLYRVPLCYVPAIFNMTIESGTTTLTPKLNYGYGQYREPVTLKGESMVFERSSNKNMQSKNQYIGRMESTGSDYKRKRINNVESYIRNRVIGFVGRYPGVSAKELSIFYNSLTVTRKLRSEADIGKIVRKYGIRVNKEGTYEISFYKRTRTNRTKMVRDRPPENNEFHDAKDSFDD